jgi:hypothetical protein
MSEAVGDRLPPDLLAVLDGSDPRAQLGKVVVVATIDADGFPHTSLLSPGEMLALDERRVRLALFANGHTIRNVEARDRVVLVFLDTDLCYYVRGHGRVEGREVGPGPTQPLPARVVDVAVEQVFRDGEAGAWVTTGARYARDIAPEEELREWERVWDALRD